MTYFNTNSLHGDELRERRSRSFTQEEEILEYFRRHKRLSPSELHGKYFSSRVPITSVRRAITVLTTCGKLKKTGDKVIGMYGDKENVWELVEQQLKLF